MLNVKNVLRIVLFEVGEELGIGEVMQSRSVVCHLVAVSQRDMVDSRMVAVLALVHAGCSAQV